MTSGQHEVSSRLEGSVSTEFDDLKIEKAGHITRHNLAIRSEDRWHAVTLVLLTRSMFATSRSVISDIIVRCGAFAKDANFIGVELEHFGVL